MMVSCRVLHAESRIIKVYEVERRVVGKNVMHVFMEKLKDALRNVYDLKGVKVGFSVDKTTTMNKFIVEVSRMVGCNAIRDGVFVVIMDGMKLIFAGVL